MLRNLLLAALAAGLATVGTPARAAASYRVDFANVPGIGRVNTAMPTDTKIHPPAFIPHADHFTRAEFEAEQRHEAEVESRVQPGFDAGAPATIRLIKRQLVHELFLEQTAVACSPIPRAAFWVYQWIYAPPQRRPELDNLFENRQASFDDTAHCEPARLRVDHWGGVRAAGRNAQAMVAGAYEYLEGARWLPSRRIWKVELRRSDHRWRIAGESITVPGEGPD